MMQRIAFTICSNNYLAQAKALGESLTKNNPKFQFLIFLVDKVSDKVDYEYFAPFNVISVEELGIIGLEKMISKYNITELNTAVKPFIFEFLFKGFQKVEFILYFDPDILVYRSFDVLENNFKEFDFIVTPHFFTPIYDQFFLREHDILNAGLYNLGFIGIKNGSQAASFLNWWKNKLSELCFIDFRNGLFVDQIWINFLPIYYDRVLILRHLGYNVAYWNLHERSVAKDLQGHYQINGVFPLIFFHFSGYNFFSPEILSKYQNRYSFEQRPDVKPLFEEYHQLVLDNGFERFSQLKCQFEILKPKDTKRPSTNALISRIMNKLKRSLAGTKF